MRHFALAALLLLCNAGLANQAIKGSVANDSGKPVPGAQVILLRSYPEEAGIEIGRATSDTSGDFSISYEEPPLSSLPAAMHLVASSANCLGIETISNPRISRRVIVTGTVNAFGMVIDDNEKPMPEASVELDHITRLSYFGMEELDYTRIRPALRIKPAVTDAGGGFRIDNLPSASGFSFLARKDGYEDTVGAGAIRMKPGKPSLGWISGKVIDGSAKLPIAGVRVTVVQTDSEDGRHWATLTKSDGSFELDSLPSGTYSLFVLEADKPVQPVEGIKVNASQTSEVKLLAVEGTLVRGRVVDRVTGEGIAGVMVISPGSRPVLSGSDGSFSIRMLPGPGILSVVGRSQGYKRLEHEMDVPEIGEVTGIKLLLWHAVKVSGQVFESGKPVEGALIRLITDNGPVGLAESDPDGSYSFVLESKPKSVYLAAYNPLTRWAALSSIPDIILHPPAMISGTVKDSAGKPIPNANILPMLKVGRLKIHALHNQTRSDSDGKFTITGLIPDATYTFRIEAAGFEPAAIPLDAKLVSGKTATTAFVLQRSK